jgi:hypothetical protein
LKELTAVELGTFRPCYGFKQLSKMLVFFLLMMTKLLGSVFGWLEKRGGDEFVRLRGRSGSARQ